MQYTTKYETPLGSVLLAADETGLTGLWFDGAGYYAAGLAARHEEKEVPVFEKVRTWLDLYFSGKQPECLPPLHMIGSPFRIRVWEMLLQIPYGQTMTYGELAAQIAKERGIERMSAQAGAQSDLHSHSVSPDGGNERQPDRVCGRHPEKGRTVKAGRRCGGEPVCAIVVLCCCALSVCGKNQRGEPACRNYCCWRTISA